MKLDKFEQLIKRLSDKQSHTVDTDMLWKKVQPEIESHERSKKRAIIWWWSGAAIFIMTMALLYLFYSNTQYFSPEANKQPSNPKQKNDIFAQKTPLSENTSDATTAQAHTNHSEIAINNSNESTYEKDINKSQSNAQSYTTNPSLRSSDNTTTTPNPFNTSYKTIQNSVEYLVPPLPRNNLVWSIHIPKIQPFLPQFESIKSDDIAHLPLTISPFDTPLFWPAITGTHPTDDDVQKWEFKIGGGYTQLFTHYNTSSNGSLEDLFRSNVERSLKSSHFHSEFIWNISPKWYLSSGLAISLLNKQSNVTITDNIYIVVTNTPQTIITPSSNNRTTGSTIFSYTLQFPVSRNSRLTMLQVPLTLGHQWTSRRWRAGVETGLLWNTIISKAGLIHPEPNEEYNIGFDAESWYRDTPTLAQHVGVWLGYRINKKTTIYLQNSYFHHWQGVQSENADFTEKPHQINFSLGVRKAISRL